MQCRKKSTNLADALNIQILANLMFASCDNFSIRGVQRKLTRLVQDLLKSRVLAGFEHPVEQKAAQAKCPQDDHDGSYNLACMVEVGVREGGYGHRDESCAPQGIIELLCLEGASNGPTSLQAIPFSH